MIAYLELDDDYDDDDGESARL